MVRVGLVFPLALVLIVCVGSAFSLNCYSCGIGSADCDPTVPGEDTGCAQNDEYCQTQFNDMGKPLSKTCMTKDEMERAKAAYPEQKGQCWSKTKEDKALTCICSGENCNEKSTPGDYTSSSGGGGGGGGGDGGGSGKGSSSFTKPTVWTNLLWIGLVLASAFSSRLRAV